MLNEGLGVTRRSDTGTTTDLNNKCRNWGWDFAQIWRRLLFLSFFVFWLPSSRETEFSLVFCADFWCADFCAHFLLRRFSVHRSSEDLSSTFLCLKKGVPESRKNEHQIRGKNLPKSNGPARVGILFHLRFLEQTAPHTIAAKPMYSRRACERLWWHLWAERHACFCSKNPLLNHPRPSYRAENHTNPKVGQKCQPDMQIPLRQGIEKYQKNTPKIRILLSSEWQAPF